MAKGDVTMQFDADTAAAVQKMLALRDSILATADATREFGEHAGRAGEKAESAFGKAGEGAVELAVKLTGISSAMSIVEKSFELGKKSVEEYFKLQEEKTNKLLGGANQVNSALAASRQGGQSAEVREALEKMKFIGGGAVNPEERSQIFAAISAAAPYASTGDKVAATKAALLGRADNMSVEEASRLGITFANAAGRREGRTDEQLQDFAFNHPEGLEGRNLTFYNRAKDPALAARILAAGARSQEATKGLLSLQEAQEDEFDPGKVKKLHDEIKHAGRHATDDQRRELRLAEMQPQDRITAMLADESLVAPAQRAAVRSLRSQLDQLPADRSLAADVRHTIGSEDEAGRLARRRRNNDALQAQNDEEGAVEAAKKLVYREQQTTIMRAGLPDELKWLAPAMTRMQHTGSDLSGNEIGDIGKPGRQMSAADWASAHQPHNLIHEELKKQTQLLSDQNSTLRTRRDTTLSNNSEGQK